MGTNKSKTDEAVKADKKNFHTYAYAYFIRNTIYPWHTLMRAHRVRSINIKMI